MEGLLTGAFFQSYLRNSAGFCLLIHQRRAYPPAPVNIMHPAPIRATVLTGNPDEPAGARAAAGTRVFWYGTGWESVQGPGKSITGKRPQKKCTAKKNPCRSGTGKISLHPAMGHRINRSRGNMNMRQARSGPSGNPRTSHRSGMSGSTRNRSGSPAGLLPRQATGHSSCA